MKVNLHFTFLGHSGGIPEPENIFLQEVTKHNGVVDDTNFTLSTYSQKHINQKIPTQILQRGHIFKNIKNMRAFLKKNQVDIIFYHYHTSPVFLYGKPFIIKIHDCNFLKTNELIPTCINAIFARAITTPSIATKKELECFFKKIGCKHLNKKIFVIANPIDQNFIQKLQKPNINLLQKYITQNEQFFFTLGSDDLSFICQNVKKATDKKLIVGGTIDELTKKTILKQNTNCILTGYLTRDELAALYHYATAFIYKNTIEGFGYIPIEATIAGTPVVTNAIPSTIELLGNLCDYYSNEQEFQKIITQHSVQSRRIIFNHTHKYEGLYLLKQNLLILNKKI